MKKKVYISETDLIKEWDFVRNSNLDPRKISSGSRKKVWWICGKRHRWEAVVYSRTNRNSCPYCSGKKVCKDNCLATLRPALAAQWHPTNNKDLTPSNVTCGSHKKVWWQCKKGHEWIATVYRRTDSFNCPYCSGRKTCIENCLATLSPTLAAEWHHAKNGKLTPNSITCGSDKKVWWKCVKGHEWKAQIASRNNGNDCPYCSGHRVCNDNCLAMLRPDIAEEWHPTKNCELTPNDVTISSGKKIWWKCVKGHEWKAYVFNRLKGKGCPYCTNRKACKDNCLATLNSDLAKQWHPTKNGFLTPSDVTYGSHKKVWWQCAKGHEWKAAVYSRADGKGCPICFNGPTSKISRDWLDSLKISTENREVWLGELKLRVDGFDPRAKIVYEFLGDYWHGNPEKYPANKINAHNKKSFGQLYEETKARILRLEQAGYKVVYVWEKDYLFSQ